MIRNVLNICQKINFKLNLYELLLSFAIFLIVLTALISVKKLMHMIQKNKLIDERMRERRSRIAQAAAEIDYSVITMSKTPYDYQNTEITLSQEESSSKKDEMPIQGSKSKNSGQAHRIRLLHHFLGEQHSVNEKIPEEVPKKKKTRAMSMEERWAEFDKKRAARNSA